MIRFTLNPRYADTLRAFGLDNYQNISTTQLGEVLEANQKRDTRRLTLGDEVFYLKRTKTEKIQSAIEFLLMGRVPHSKPYREAQHIHNLQQNHICTMEVVAYGEHTHLGMPRGGFILSKAVAGIEAESYFQQAQPAERLALCLAFGKLTGQLHSKGFFATTRLKDVFLQKSNDEYQLTLIDRETRNPKPKKFTLRRAKRSLSDSFRRQSRDGSRYSNTERQQFMHGYQQVIASLCPKATTVLTAACNL